MSSSSPRQCPECGTTNRLHSKICHQCSAPLVDDWQDRPRVRRKVLLRTDFMAAARANRKATRRLVVILLLILAVLGYLLGWSAQAAVSNYDPGGDASIWFASSWGFRGALVLIAIGAIWSWISFRRGDRVILRMTGANAVTAEEEPQLHNVVAEMAIAAGIRKPRIYIIETDALNAFATGMHPSRASIGVTRGLLQTLNREELQGVIGHEMGHIVNWDIRYATAVGVLVGLIALVSDGAMRSLFYSRGSRSSGGRGSRGAVVIVLFLLVFAALAPLFSRLVQMAVSRQREFLADATSVRLTRHPEGLISALGKLALNAKPFKGANRATQHMFIINPFRNFSEKASALLATHPPLARRITRLQNLEE
ncbi:MAG: M48 family metalloprotease [Pseudomonadota bacterium]|nr:M48 family metalloprotease [Pseudomonadota bacterium]